jgi:hypothetical protein
MNGEKRDLDLDNKPSKIALHNVKVNKDDYDVLLAIKTDNYQKFKDI